MVCQNCVDGETCPDCEKHPHDIHTTPPNFWFYEYPIADPRLIHALLEERVEYLEGEVRQLKERLLRGGIL
jgi:hypothetical protein